MTFGAASRDDLVATARIRPRSTGSPSAFGLWLYESLTVEPLDPGMRRAVADHRAAALTHRDDRPPGAPALSGSVGVGGLAQGGGEAAQDVL